jgi:predicted metal-dependent phosphotriesterase family hydrolase
VHHNQKLLCALATAIQENSQTWLTHAAYVTMGPGRLFMLRAMVVVPSRVTSGEEDDQDWVLLVQTSHGEFLVFQPSGPKVSIAGVDHYEQVVFRGSASHIDAVPGLLV